MSNFKKDTYKLKLSPDKKNDWVKISVFDANNNLMSKQMGGFEDNLPKGLYTVVSELSGSTTEQIIKHTADSTMPIETPSMAMEQTQIDYEIISTKQSSCQKITFNNPRISNNTQNASLFIFCHDINDEKQCNVMNVWQHLSVYDSANKRVFKLDKDDWNKSEKQGWICFQAELEPGMYFLNYKKGLKNRSFSVLFSPGFQTQVILPVGKKPNFDSIQMNMVKAEIAHKSNTDFYESYITAKIKLLNADYNISEKVIKDLSYGKWKHPFYGIMVAYIYLLSEQSNHDRLFEDVLSNLEFEILRGKHNPDLTVLRLFYKLRKDPDNVDKWINENPINSVPMFRVGVDKIIELSYQYPALIKENGMLDLIAGRLYYNTIWTCFKPTKLKYNFEVETNTSRSFKSNNLFGKLNDKIDDLKHIADLLDDFLPAIMELQKARDRELTSMDMARSIGIPLVTFKRKVSELNRILTNYNRAIKVVVKYLEKFFDREFDEDEVLDYIERLGDNTAE
jgi:hypothetical protein